MKLLFIFFCVFLCQYSNGQEVNKLINEAISYEKMLDENKALEKYLEALKMQQDNVFVLSHISELYCSIAGRTKTDRVKQDSYFKLANIYASKALHVDPKSSDANFVMALVLGRTAIKRSGKEKIDAVKAIKKYTDLSLQYNPHNFKAWFLLGKWNYEISGLNFFEKTAVKMFYGDLPSASTKDAIAAYNKSMELMPGFLFNYLSLARAYNRIGNKTKAKELLNTMLKLPIRSADDSTIKYDGGLLLKKL